MLPQKLPMLKDRPMSEAEVTREIREYLRVCGIFHWKQFQGLGALPGVADIIGCWRGRFLAIEVKKVGLKPTPAQRKFIDQVNAAGGIAFCAHSAQEVDERLRG